MSTPIHTFADSPFRSALMADLLDMGLARPGLTLVAALDHENKQVLGVVRLVTPRPPEANIDAILSNVMSPRLSQIAYLFSPEDGKPIRRPTRELVTIVCRDGAPVATPSEEQFARAWRLARDEAPVARGDVYVVTPQGWARLGGGVGGYPFLVLDGSSDVADDDVLEFPPLVDGDALASDPGVVAAEKLLAELFEANFATYAAVEPKECLACYVTRMLAQFGCNGTWRFVDHFRETQAPRATALEGRPWRRDGQCDCDLYHLGYVLAEHIEDPVEYTDGEASPMAIYYEWPWPAHVAYACLRVRRGTVRPCALWQRTPRALGFGA